MDTDHIEWLMSETFGSGMVQMGTRNNITAASVLLDLCEVHASLQGNNVFIEVYVGGKTVRQRHIRARSEKCVENTRKALQEAREFLVQLHEDLETSVKMWPTSTSEPKFPISAFAKDDFVEAGVKGVTAEDFVPDEVVSLNQSDDFLEAIFGTAD